MIKMRNKNRIDPFLARLGNVWKCVPDWRFGQLMVNVLNSMEKDPFFPEEDEILEHIREIGEIYYDLEPQYFELVQPFSKEDLKDGDIVTLRNGDRLVLVNKIFKDTTNENNNYLGNLDDLNEDLTYEWLEKNEDYDIIKVERPIGYITVYERREKQEVKEMTVEEISKKLGYEVKIVKEK